MFEQVQFCSSPLGESFTIPLGESFTIPLGESFTIPLGEHSTKHDNNYNSRYHCMPTGAKPVDFVEEAFAVIEPAEQVKMLAYTTDAGTGS